MAVIIDRIPSIPQSSARNEDSESAWPGTLFTPVIRWVSLSGPSIRKADVAVFVSSLYDPSLTAMQVPSEMELAR